MKLQPSRGSNRPSERGQVSPLVWLVERVRVVCGVTGVHFGSAVAGQQRSEGFVHQRRIWLPGRLAGALEEACVHCRAEACATHATIMP